MGLWRDAPVLVMCGVGVVVGCASQQKKDTPVVKALRISGNDEISSRQIRKKIVTSETGWWPFAHKQLFDPVAWQADLDRIQRLYAASGFYHAEVVKDEVSPRPPDGVALEVHIKEGKPTKVGRVDIQGLDGLPPADRVAALGRLP